MSKLDGSYESKFHGWQTPSEIYIPLLLLIGRQYFDFDVCTTDFNIPAAHYYTEDGMYSRYGNLEDNIVRKVDDFIGTGLSGKWVGDIWCNSPHGQLLKKFAKKAYLEYTQGYCNIWLLLPVGDRTRNVYYHEFVFKNAGFIVFLAGKISFLKHGKQEGTAPSSYMLVYFGRNAEKLAEKWIKSPPLAGTLMRVCK